MMRYKREYCFIADAAFCRRESRPDKQAPGPRDDPFRPECWAPGHSGINMHDSHSPRGLVSSWRSQCINPGGLGSSPSNGLGRVSQPSVKSWTRCAIQLVSSPLPPSKRDGTRFQGGSALSGLQTRQLQYVGFDGISFLDCQTVDTQNLESSRRAGAPARGMWAGRTRNSILWVPPTTHAVQFCVDPEYICITGVSIGKHSTSPIFVMGNSAFGNATVHRGVLTRTSIRSSLWGRG